MTCEEFRRYLREENPVVTLEIVQAIQEHAQTCRDKKC